MVIEFNGNKYIKGATDNGLGRLCFDIFKHYLYKNQDKSIEQIKETFNEIKNNSVLSENEFNEWYENANDNGKDKRYFGFGRFENDKIEFKNELLYFTTQWGNNEKYKNVDNMIHFAQKQGYIINNSNNLDENYNKKNTVKQPLNQILYGSPGTGKTYNTINKALEIIFSDKLTKDDYKKGMLKEERLLDLSKEILTEEEKKNSDTTPRKIIQYCFEKLKKAGQIEFITFHQSYGYEEFVEGIKAEIDENNNISYTVKSGIFKRISEHAKELKIEKSSSYDFENNVNIWKISLGNSQNSYEDFLFDFCIENNKIVLGFGEYIDFSDCKDRNSIADRLNDKESYSYPPTAIDTLKNKMKMGDIVIVSYGNTMTRAIGKVSSEYHLIDNDILDSYVQARSVDWLLVPSEPFSYEKILKKRFSQMTIYNIKNNVKIDELRELLSKKESTENNNKNFVLIIDEINRGNISKIFGELITLIEDSKRIGSEKR